MKDVIIVPFNNFVQGFAQYHCKDTKWITAACSLKKLIAAYCLFYRDGSQSNVYHLKQFLKMLDPYLVKEKEKENNYVKS